MQILSLFLDSCLATEAHTASTRVCLKNGDAMSILWHFVFFSSAKCYVAMYFSRFFCLVTACLQVCHIFQSQGHCRAGLHQSLRLGSPNAPRRTQGTGGTGGTGRWYRTKFSETLSNLSTSSLEARLTGDRRQRVEVI